MVASSFANKKKHDYPAGPCTAAHGIRRWNCYYWCRLLVCISIYWPYRRLSGAGTAITSAPGAGFSVARSGPPEQHFQRLPAPDWHFRRLPAPGSPGASFAPFASIRAHRHLLAFIGLYCNLLAFRRPGALEGAGGRWRLPGRRAASRPSGPRAHCDPRFPAPDGHWFHCRLLHFIGIYCLIGAASSESSAGSADFPARQYPEH